MTWSKVLFVVGLTAFSFGAFHMFMAYETPKTAYGKGKLGASSDNSSDPIKMAMNSMSVVIWGLVAAKAKTGLNAASAKDASTVSQAFSRVISMSLLIVLATCLNLYSSNTLDLDDSLTLSSEKTHHTLQSSR